MRRSTAPPILAEAEELFREAGVWEEGFTVSVITEDANLFEMAALVLKDSIERLNPNIQIRVLAVAEAQFDEAHASDPVPYAMWVKNADPFADPHAYMQAYQHPDGEWGQVHGFANGVPESRPESHRSSTRRRSRLDVERRAELVLGAADPAVRGSDVAHRRAGGRGERPPHVGRGLHPQPTVATTQHEVLPLRQVERVIRAGAHRAPRPDQPERRRLRCRSVTTCSAG